MSTYLCPYAGPQKNVPLIYSSMNREYTQTLWKSIFNPNKDRALDRGMGHHTPQKTTSEFLSPPKMYMVGDIHKQTLNSEGAVWYSYSHNYTR